MRSELFKFGTGRRVPCCWSQGKERQRNKSKSSPLDEALIQWKLSPAFESRVVFQGAPWPLAARAVRSAGWPKDAKCVWSWEDASEIDDTSQGVYLHSLDQGHA